MFNKRKNSFVATLGLIIATFLALPLITSAMLQTTPLLRLSAPSTAYVNEVAMIDARESTGVSKVPQTDSSPSFTISFGDGLSTNLRATGHAYRKAGTYTITVTGKDTAGTTATLTRTITVTEIPAATPANTQVVNMTADIFANRTLLQNAIDLAASRNSSFEQEIIVPAGARIAGSIVTTKPVGDKYITIKSSNIVSLPAGQRVAPDSTNMFQILSIDGREAFIGPSPQNGTNHYRFQGMKVGQLDSTIYVHHLAVIGSHSGPYELEVLPHHFIIDRCWFDGGPNDTDQIRSGLSIYGDSVSVVDSHFAEFRRIGGGVDSQALGVTLGQGPYAFINNYLVATSENVNLGSGGAAYLGQATVTNPTKSTVTLSHVKNLKVDMNLALKVGGVYNAANSTIVRAINGNTVTFDELPVAPDDNSAAEWSAQPSFIEFRGNHCFKPLKWFPRHSTWNGINYQIKNLYESKFSLYTTIDGNVFENSWSADQSYALALTPRYGNGGESHAAVIREMQWSNNIVKNAAAGINILSDDYANPTQRAEDITLRNMLFQNVGSGFDGEGAVHMLVNMQNGNTRMRRLYFINLTWDHGYPANQYQSITDFGNSGGADDSAFLNCLVQDGGYGLWSNKGFDFISAMATYMPGPSWRGNVVINDNGHTYPAGTKVANTPWDSQFVNKAGGDYTVVSTSVAKAAGLDGRDAGVNMAELSYATRGAVSGIWDGSTPTPIPSPSPTPSPTPTPTPVPTPSPIPTPVPCTITGPNSITVPSNSSSVIYINLNGVSSPTQVTVVGSSGQVTISPLSRIVQPTGASLAFSVKVKKQSKSITFQSPCGNKSVQVNVQ